MTNQELKTKFKQIMLDHLKEKGWPNVANRDQLVFDELLHMWDKIHQTGLVPKGYTFEHFKTVAIQMYNFTEMKRHFDTLVGKRK